MAAGQGFKTFTTGEVLTAADVNGYLMQGVLVFASAAARDAAITSPQEGQFAFTKDTNGLWYYDGAAWVASGATGDIEGVTAGVGISGGGTSGTVTITNSMATAITTAGDLIKGTGSGTFDRLGIGSTGQVLTVTAGAPAWATPAAGGGGKVLQVVQGTYSTTTVINTTTFTDTGLSLAITPTLSTSKVLVMINQQMEIERASSELGSGVRLLRGGTTVFDQASGVFFGSQGIQVNSATGVGNNAICSFNYLDSPATTSSTTYKMQARPSTSANSGLIRAQGSGSTSVITLLEIGA
jgi:hypothetical protein